MASLVVQFLPLRIEATYTFMKVASFAAGQTPELTKSFEEAFEEANTASVADYITAELGTVAAGYAINTTLRV